MKLVVLLEEGARVEIVSAEVAAVPLLRLTVLGEKLQEMPIGIPLGGHARVTGLEDVLAGATVMVTGAELPAEMDERGLAERLKSGMLTLTLRVVEPLWK